MNRFLGTAAAAILLCGLAADCRAQRHEPHVYGWNYGPNRPGGYYTHSYRLSAPHNWVDDDGEYEWESYPGVSWYNTRPYATWKFATPYHYNPHDSTFYPPYWRSTTQFNYYGYDTGTHYAPYANHVGLSVGPPYGSRVLVPTFGAGYAAAEPTQTIVGGSNGHGWHGGGSHSGHGSADCAKPAKPDCAKPKDKD